MALEANKHLNSPSPSESQSNLEPAQKLKLLGTWASKSLRCFWICWPESAADILHVYSHSQALPWRIYRLETWNPSWQNQWGWRSADVLVQGVCGSAAVTGSTPNWISSQGQRLRPSSQAHSSVWKGWGMRDQCAKAQCVRDFCHSGCAYQASYRGYWVTNLKDI